jgi:ubiquinone/menaquinone biosynthesis C-methylase UbiE
MSEPKTVATSEMETLKTKLKATWSTGDFGQIAQAYLPEAAEFVERLKLQAGEKVLDVACGAGSTAIPAARSGARVVGIDIAPYLVEQARENAKIEEVNCQFEEGDAESLDFPDGSFDTVITMFGAMFAPRPEKASAEMIRVCRSGGRIVMANWTPTGFIGKMFKIGISHVPPPPNMPLPVLWGVESNVHERLKDGIADLQCKPALITFNFPFSPEEVVAHYRKYFGPTQKAFDALAEDEAKQAELRRELEDHWKENNQATDGTTRIQSEYLEVIARRE